MENGLIAIPDEIVLSKIYLVRGHKVVSIRQPPYFK